MRRNTRLSLDRLEERLALSSAPLLDTSVPLSMLEIAEDAGPPQGAVGTPVASLIDHGGSLNNFSDADGDVPGIAIIQTATQGGTLWSSTDDGVTWEPVEGASASNPEVLFATPGNRLYFEPAPNFNGVVDELFSFRAVGVAADAVATWQGRGFGLTEQMSSDWISLAALNNIGIGTSTVTFFATASSSDGTTLIEVGPLDGSGPPQLRVTSFSPETGDLVVGQALTIASTNAGRLSAALSHDGERAIVTNLIQTEPSQGSSFVANWRTDVYFFDTSDFMEPKLLAGPIAAAEGGGDLYGYRLPDQWVSYAFSRDSQKAIVRKYDQDGLLVFDVVDLSLLDGFGVAAEVRGFPIPRTGPLLPRDQTEWISEDGKRAMIYDTSHHLAGVDLSGPKSPERGENFSTATVIEACFSADGKTFYAIELGEYLAVYDTTVVTAPILLTRVPVPMAVSLQVMDDAALVLVAAADGSVSAVDVAKPDSAFVQETSTPFPMFSHRIAEDTQMQFMSTNSGQDVFLVSLTELSSGQEFRGFRGGYPTNTLKSFSVRSGSVGISVSAVDDVLVVDGGQSGVLNAARVAASTLRVSDADGLGDYGVFALQSPPQHGSAVVFDGSGQWLYYAGPSFAGEDQFTVRITDISGGYTDQVISVTGEPSRTIGFLANMVIHQSYSTSAASYSLPALGPEGELLDGKVARITATSSNTALIPHPTPIYASADIPESISFTPVVDASGTATISIQVEDGGADNDLATAEDNGRATHQIEVKVLEVISSASGVVLSKDEANHIYAATQPIMLEQQQAPALIMGFAAIGAEEGNVLLVERDGTTSRLVTEEGWGIRDLFHSLRNHSSAILNPVSRDPREFSLTAIAGAYEIDGIENQTITVRRGQRVTFDLNVTGHPFYLQTTGGGYAPANVYSDGFSGNGQTAGRYEWIVPEDAPDELFYQCEFHPVMFGKIVVVD